MLQTQILLYKMTRFHSNTSPPKLTNNPDAEFRGSQIIQHLFEVRIGQFFDSFGLKENLLPDNEVRVVIVREDNSFVRDLVIFLARKRNSSTIQFNNESVLVDHFVVALSQLTMNFHAKTHQLKNFFLVKQFRHKLQELQRL